nr:hypothetical protein [uncultured Niameybacter sp.]
MEKKKIWGIIMSLSIFVLVIIMTIGLLYIIKTQDTKVKVKDSYIKIIESRFSKDGEKCDKTMFYITPTQLQCECDVEFLKKNRTEKILIFEFKIQQEDYKTLLNYLISEAYIYPQKGKEKLDYTDTLFIEIGHKGEVKTIYCTGDEEIKEINESINKYIEIISDNGEVVYSIENP